MLMDHGYIEEHQIVSQYAMGKLDPADRVEFEEHLVDCPQCLNELELTDDFRHTLRRVVAENETVAAAQRTVAPWLFGFGGRRQTAILTAGALVLAGFTVLIFLAK